MAHLLIIEHQPADAAVINGNNRAKKTPLFVISSLPGVHQGQKTPYYFSTRTLALPPSTISSTNNPGFPISFSASTRPTGLLNRALNTLLPPSLLPLLLLLSAADSPPFTSSVSVALVLVRAPARAPSTAVSRLGSSASFRCWLLLLKIARSSQQLELLLLL